MTESELVDYVRKSIKNALETRIPGDGDTQVTRRRKKNNTLKSKPLHAHDVSHAFDVLTDFKDTSNAFPLRDSKR